MGQNGNVSHRGATGTWTPSPSITFGGKKPYFFAVWGSSSTNYWAAGGNGDTGPNAEIPIFAHYDGTGWSVQASGSSCPGIIDAIWGSSASNVFAVGRGWNCNTIVHFDGTSWSEIPTSTTEPLFGVWGFSPTDVWIVGEKGTILHLE